MKSSELSNGENRIALRQLCKTGNDVIDDVIIWVQDGNCKKWPSISFCIGYKFVSELITTKRNLGNDACITSRHKKLA